MVIFGTVNFIKINQINVGAIINRPFFKEITKNKIIKAQFFTKNSHFPYKTFDYVKNRLHLYTSLTK